jgi:hypothetical protein
MAPSEPEVTASGGVVLVDTTTEDAHINELGSTSGGLKTMKVKELGDSDKYYEKFQGILQLLLLVNALNENRNSKDSLIAIPNTAIPNTSISRKAFDYLDAITNLMVRDGEVVAAVACSGPRAIPTRGVISVNSPYKTPSNGSAQVRLQSTSCF